MTGVTRNTGLTFISLDGSDVTVEGQVNVTGGTRWEARANIASTGDINTADASQKAAYNMLSTVLREMKSQFTAADQYTGRKTNLVARVPGMHNVKPKTEAQAAQQ